MKRRLLTLVIVIILLLLICSTAGCGVEHKDEKQPQPDKQEVAELSPTFSRNNVCTYE